MNHEPNTSQGTVCLVVHFLDMGRRSLQLFFGDEAYIIRNPPPECLLRTLCLDLVHEA